MDVTSESRSCCRYDPAEHSGSLPCLPLLGAPSAVGLSPGSLLLAERVAFLILVPFPLQLSRGSSWGSSKLLLPPVGG